MTQLKSTFSFDAAAEQKLRELAESKGVTKSEVLRRAIALYDYLESQRNEKSHIKIEKPNGEKVELVLP